MAGGRKLFGTDGVRGVAGEFLTADLALALGRAVTVEAPAPRPQVLIVRDTRESGPMLEAALAAGVTAAGGDALLGGVLPTPAASLLVRRYGFDLAVVVSASHNPYADNGIKFFGPAGTKLDDEAEERVEGRLDDTPAAPRAGRIRTLEGALEDYLREIASRFRSPLDGMRVVLDCANGSAHRAAPAAFERLGAMVETLATEPDGRNINEACGSTHVELLAERMAAGAGDVGFAFDGDADRVLAVDREGRVHDGDELVAIAALHLKAAGKLDGNGVAVTVMTNYGFHQAMGEAGIEVATTAVGDRYVIEALRERGWVLGGEQSGHIVEMGFTPSGDGIAAALLTLEALAGGDLASARTFEKLPQRLVNVEVADRGAVDGAGAVWAEVERLNAQLAGRGRVLVRPSGTEPVVRVMAEAPTVEEADRVCQALAALIGRELG